MRRSEFYDGMTAIGRERGASIEIDFGYDWTDESRTWPTYAVRYIVATGEVIAMRLAQVLRDDTEVTILGKLEPDNRSHCDLVLGRWTEEIHKPNSLSWVRSRLETYGAVA